MVAFASLRQLEKWLEVNHGTERELWVRIFKKGSRTESVTWDDCVVAAIAWGWIDGQRRSFDEVSFVQRFDTASCQIKLVEKRTPNMPSV